MNQIELCYELEISEEYTIYLEQFGIVYHVIEYQGIRSLVAVKPKYSDRLYWFGGRSYMRMGDDVTILHTFDPVDDSDDEDNIEIAFWREWNPAPMGKPSKHGWLSPEGKFYPCGYAEHESTARQLVAMFYNLLDDSRELENRRWLRIQDGRIVYRDRPEITQPQLDILWDIARIPDLDDTQRRWAERDLKYLTED